MSIAHSAKPAWHDYPAELLGEYARLKLRVLAALEAREAAPPARLIDLLHRLGGSAGLFGEPGLGEHCKALGLRIEAGAAAALSCAALAQALRASLPKESLPPQTLLAG